MNIKVCGITQLKQLQQLDALDIDFAGFIFHKQSPRYAGDKLKPADLRDSDFDIRKIGVFVDASLDEILDTVDDYGLDAVQLHGKESPDLCKKLSAETEVIKVFGITAETSNLDDLLAPYDPVCDYYLFDTGGGKTAGGTGVQFDWGIVERTKIEKPFFLSGGIALEDAAKLKAFRHPDFYGVDINSRFESAPGVKDMAAVLRFREALKNK